MKEDNHFLKESNIFIRNEFNKALCGKEDRHNKQGGGIKPGKSIKDKDRIYIFESAKTENNAEKIVEFRNFLKENNVRKIIPVNFEDLSRNVSDPNEKVLVEESFLLMNNSRNFPIIFYGGNYDTFLLFRSRCRWNKRKDIEWIENPWEIQVLMGALKEMSGR
mgnify:CR=1 FL=1